MINQEKEVNSVELTKLNADLKPLGYECTYNYFPGNIDVQLQNDKYSYTLNLRFLNKSVTYL